MRNVPFRPSNLRALQLALFTFTLITSQAAQGAKTLDIYFIDVEGGQATLLVSPSGQTLLIDTGYAGNSGRDANRIALAAKKAGVKRIDNLLITHNHADHVGGVENLLVRLPVANFFDKGPNVEEDNKYPEPYEKAFASGRHQVVAPGDKIPVKGLEVTVLTGAHKTVDAKAIPGTGQDNPFCAGLQPKTDEEGENPQSAGVLVQFGKFRFVDPGDIIWNEELALECPQNKVGEADVYLTAHHATHLSPKSVWGLKPRVIVMDNGPRKGGLPEAWKLLRETPGLEDIWQIHFSLAGAKEANAPDTFIANVDTENDGQYLKLSASEDGSFTIYNPRNKYTKSYPAR
jgi:competence protein ComEC